jgi:hypothetical protein
VIGFPPIDAELIDEPLSVVDSQLIPTFPIGKDNQITSLSLPVDMSENSPFFEGPAEHTFMRPVSPRWRTWNTSSLFSVLRSRRNPQRQSIWESDLNSSNPSKTDALRAVKNHGYRRPLNRLFPIRQIDVTSNPHTMFRSNCAY